MITRKPDSLVFAAYCAAIVLLAAVVSFAVWDGARAVMPDSCQYMSSGANLLSGRGYVDTTGEPLVFYPPGYPMLIGFVNLLIPDIFLAGRIVSLLASLLTVIPIIIAGTRLFNRNVGLASGIVYALLPARATFSSTILSESLYLLLVVWAVLLWLKEAQDHTRLRAVVLGVLLGYAYLTRPEGLLFAAALFAVSLPFQRWWPTPRWNTLLISGTAMVAVMLPWILCMHTHTGHWTLSDKFRTSPGSCVARAKGVSYAEQFYLHPVEDRGDWSYVRESVPEFAIRYLKATRDEFGILQVMLGTSLFACLLLGLGLEMHRDNLLLKRFCPVAVSLGFPLLYIPALYPEVRFVFVACIPAIILGCWQLLTRFRAPWHESKGTLLRCTKYVAFCIVVVGLLNQVKPLARLKPAQTTVPQRASWLRRTLPPDSKVMSSNVEISFRSGHKWARLFSNDMPRLLRYARNVDANYLLVNDDDLHRHPEWAEQLQTLESEGSLRKLADWQGKSGERSTVYEVLSPQKEHY